MIDVDAAALPRLEPYRFEAQVTDAGRASDGEDESLRRGLLAVLEGESRPTGCFLDPFAGCSEMEFDSVFGQVTRQFLAY